MSSILLFLEMRKGKRSFDDHSALSLPSLLGDKRKTRKTRTIFSPENRTGLGSQARRLAYCLNWLLPQHPSEASRELMWSCQGFWLYQAFQHGPVSKHPGNLGMQGSVRQNDELLSSGKQLSLQHVHLQQEGILGATATSTDCTGMAGISRSSWRCDLDCESETV